MGKGPGDIDNHEHNVLVLRKKKKKKINKYNVEATRSEIRFVSHLV